MIPVITLSREYGSGGRDIGKLLAGKLGLPFYDRELIARISRSSGVPEDEVDGAETAAASHWRFEMGNFGKSGPYEMPFYDRLFRVQSDTVRKIAEEGPAVIVGRCADYVLRGRQDVVSVFVQASPEKRVDRVLRRGEAETRQQAEELIRRVEKGRASYYRYYTDRVWGDRRSYQLVLDSGVGDEAAAEVLENYIRRFDRP